MKTFKLHSITTVLMVLVTAFSAKSQTLSYNWAFTSGSANAEEVNSVATDANGNVYATGRFGGTVDFDPGTGQVLRTSAGYSDIFITKMDANGNLSWVQTFGSQTGDDEGRSVKIDANGNVYLAGKFCRSVDFDASADSTILTEKQYIYNGYTVSAGDAFLLKLSSSGQFIWARSFGLPGYDYAKSMAFDASGNIYMVGKCGLDDQSLDSFDVQDGSGTTWFYKGGGFVTKYDSGGNYQWAYEMGNTYGGFAPPWRWLYNMDITDVGVYGSKLILIGHFFNTADFNPKSGVNSYTSSNGSQSSNVYYDGFIASYDLNMNLSSVSTFGGTASICNFNALAIDANGHMHIAGTHTGTIDYDPTSTVVNLTAAVTGGRSDALILKIRKAGTLAWAKLLGTNGTETALALAVDATGNVYSTGYFNGTADFNPAPKTTYNLKTTGLADIFISKLSSTGAFVWARKMGSTADDYGKGIALKEGENTEVYTGGYYKGTCDFNQESGVDSRTTAGANDLFLHKLTEAGTSSAMVLGTNADQITPSPFVIYPVPANNVIHVGSNTLISDFTVEIFSMDGKLVISAPANQAHSIDLSLVQPGIYTMKITSPGQTITRKFIKH